MTAERPGGEKPTPRAELTASPANAETPAVSYCNGVYLKHPRRHYDEHWAECDRCGLTGPAGHRCGQTVVPTKGSA